MNETEKSDNKRDSSKLFGSLQFIMSASTHTDLPLECSYEIAFIGRSNSGKSSMINAISNCRKKAKTSSTPGKTRLLNIFISKCLNLQLIDLPGYGFAKISKVERDRIGKMSWDYLLNREALKHVFWFIDSRRGIMDIDRSMIARMLEKRPDVENTLLFTKIDKLNMRDKSRVKSNITVREGPTINISDRYLDLILTSSKSTEGLEELKDYVARKALS